MTPMGLAGEERFELSRTASKTVVLSITPFPYENMPDASDMFALLTAVVRVFEPRAGLEPALRVFPFRLLCLVSSQLHHLDARACIGSYKPIEEYRGGQDFRLIFLMGAGQ